VTPPRLEACYFGDHGSDVWRRMAAVLEATALEQCKGWQVNVRRVEPERRVSALGVDSHARNTEKMDEWHRIVMGSADGDRVLLIDTDTFIVKPLDDVWSLEFDLAYTTKPSRFPFNSGVVFLRISDRVRGFVEDWRNENIRMLGDRRYHVPWRAKYGGINQAALGAILDRNGLHGLDVRQLPCAEWNCEDSSWWSTGPEKARIVHVKSALRKAIFHKQPPDWIRHTKQECDRFRAWVQAYRQIEGSLVTAQTA
jgi:hypothetical protein